MLAGKKHYHCKHCKYSSHKADHFQKHIISHKSEKLVAKVTDDIKETCKKSFISFINNSHSEDCECKTPHVHCNICLHWVCAIKKVSKNYLQCFSYEDMLQIQHVVAVV